MVVKSKRLERIIDDLEASEFAKRFIGRCNVDEERIKQTQSLLEKMGWNEDRVASMGPLLGLSQNTILEAYALLKELGATDAKIASTRSNILGKKTKKTKINIQLLKELGATDAKLASRLELWGKKPETTQRNIEALRKLGATDAKLASHPHLLALNPETIKRNYLTLRGLGIEERRIITNIHLLGIPPRTTRRNYQNHVGLLREDYGDRNSGRDLLTTYVKLLGIPPATLNSNVQYLYSLGLDYHNGFLLGTRPHTKRKKLAWILRELFEYRTVPEEKRNETIRELYSFIRKRPNILVRSITYLERNKDRLKDLVSELR